MGKIISFKGTLAMGLQDEINLRTLNGKTGYKINKFQIFPTNPGQATQELIGQIFKTDQTGSISTTIEFTDSNLLAVAFYTNHATTNYSSNTDTIIFDNEKFNQNIFINMTDAEGGTIPANYYVELETMPLSDLEATQLTLQSLRNLKNK